MFNKLLVANRGEIACRVMRTAQRLGYRTVAVFSQADADETHVRMADEAVCIGGPAAADSYLNIAALLDAASRTGADAVHPGYGFLSERADFAQACLDAGLVFVGPPPSAIQAMGDKAQAKQRMRAAGVPCAPGWPMDQTQADPNDELLTAQAQRLGLPLLVKAVAGGGGRGMRLVRQWHELPQALISARREAQSAFGNGSLMLERLIQDARHIEVQVFCDQHGNAVHLGERDCTAQRRRQKIIEEAPSPVVGLELRAAMGRDALAAARAVGYVGAGTVEFIVDAQLQHHFLEMNTRLQVEHPVTECITGLDLVEWQLRVAAGEPLPLTQAQIRFSGHAIEARLVAEDPYEGWQPQSGVISGWWPERAEALGVRVDHGIQAGQAVTPFYDAMVAKFIAHGSSRADATRRLLRALQQSPLLGLPTNARFLCDLLQHPQFVAAELSTTRLDEWAEDPHSEAAGLMQRPAPPDWAWGVAACLLSNAASPAAAGSAGSFATASATASASTSTTPVAAAAATAWRPQSVAAFDLKLQCQGQQRSLRTPLQGVRLLSWQGLEARVEVDGVQHALLAQRSALGPGLDAQPSAGHSLQLCLQGSVFCFEETSPYPARSTASHPGQARAPVAGVVAQLLVQVGDRVAAGQALLSVEAMKMEMWLHAGAAGVVSAVHARVGDSVAARSLLVEIEIDSQTGSTSGSISGSISGSKSGNKSDSPQGADTGRKSGDHIDAAAEAARPESPASQPGPST